jgi:acetoin:2,6-dichlorophenolindophenol oxidoreductase subunit alpha
LSNDRQAGLDSSSSGGAPKRLEWFYQMCLIRAFESEIHILNKAGLVNGTAHLYIGMEAIAVGACAAMAEGDLLTSTHRGHGHCLARGMDPARMMAEILSRSGGYCRGKGGSMHIADRSKGVLGADGIVGGGIPIAVGAAHGLRLLKQPSVVLCFFGDGASNQGSFHEALNLASIQRLPVVFLCENNQWALSAGFLETTAGGSVAKRAAAYGMAAEEVDGNDVEAVFAAVEAAASRARTGLGPALVECQSYRWEPHSIFTRQEIRPQEEIDDWKRRDPIERYKRVLLEKEIATPEQLSQIAANVEAEIGRAVAFAKASPSPDEQTALQDIYA